MDYSESTECDQEIIDQKRLIGPVDAGYVKCTGNCYFGENIDMEFYCTDFSALEGWSAGTREHQVTLPGADTYVIR